MIARLALAFVLAAAAVTGSRAEEAPPRLTGEINRANFPAVEAFLRQRAAEGPVAFDVTFPLDNTDEDGHLTTWVLDGMFEVAYLDGENTVKLFADVGFELKADDNYTLTGLFDVVLDTTDAGAIALNPSGASFSGAYADIPVDTLPAVGGQ